MIIKSNFKDYYDFVANQYGGGDPKIVYVRGRLAPAIKGNTQVEGTLTVEMDSADWLLRDPNHHYFNKYAEHKWKYLVIAGRCYLIALPEGSALYSENVNSYQLQPLEDLRPNTTEHGATRAARLYRGWHGYNKDVQYGQEYQFLIDLSRRIEAPVFVISGVSSEGSSVLVTISGQCPILSAIGLPWLIDPYQMYQNLSMFVGNVLKDPPDTQPPVAVSNRSKIIKAGFDLVTSFRHRK